MRKFAISSFSFLLACFTGAAQAQSVPAYDWSGPYIGGSANFAQSRAKADALTSDSFASSYFTSPDPQQISNTTRGTIEKSNLGVGAFGGFGRQLGQLYLGVEGGLSSLHMDGTRTAGAIYISNSDGIFTNKISVRTNSQATLKARVGWAQDRWLSYLTAGVGVTKIKLNTDFRDDFLGVGASGQSSKNETKLGWILGVGGEYAFKKNWSVRYEYSYVDYGKVRTTSFVTNPAFPALGNDLTQSAELTSQMVTVGIAYRF